MKVYLKFHVVSNSILECNKQTNLFLCFITFRKCLLLVEYCISEINRSNNGVLRITTIYCNHMEAFTQQKITKVAHTLRKFQSYQKIYRMCPITKNLFCCSNKAIVNQPSHSANSKFLAHVLYKILSQAVCTHVRRVKGVPSVFFLEQFRKEDSMYNNLPSIPTRWPYVGYYGLSRGARG